MVSLASAAREDTARFSGPDRARSPTQARRFGYSVVGMASDGLEAISLAKDRSPDIILMDIMLAGAMDGIEAAKQIRAQFGIPVIFLTAYTTRRPWSARRKSSPSATSSSPSRSAAYTTIDIALYKNSIGRSCASRSGVLGDTAVDQRRDHRDRNGHGRCL